MSLLTLTPVFSSIVYSKQQNKIINIRAGNHGEIFRIVLETSSRVDAQLFLNRDPYRAIISIPESLWRAGQSPRRGNFFPNVPLSYSFQNNSLGKTNLIIKVDRPFSIDNIYWLPPNDGGERLVIDIEISNETEFVVNQKTFNRITKDLLKKVLNDSPVIKDKQFDLFEGNKNDKVVSQNSLSPDLETDKEKKTQSFLNDNLFVVVIDAGHGGKDPGAVGASKTLEKNINLIASKKLVKKLNEFKGIKAYSTREKDKFVELHERYQIAHKYKAELFVSLHSDSALSNEVSGYSIFSLNKNPDFDKANFKKNKSNKSVLANIVLENETNETQNVLYQMKQNERRNKSIILKNLILDELKGLPSNSRGWKEENFAVLKSPEIPSVLIEMGFLSNKRDEANLNNKDFLDDLTTRLAIAIYNYKKTSNR